MLQTKTQRLTTAGMLLAVGLILPFVTAHGFGLPGNVLLPMHLPVLLAGFLCGPGYGAACGLLTPVLSSLLTQMPPAFPMLPIMAGELTAYGFVSGFLFCRTSLGKKKLGVYPVLLLAMVCGRAVYGGIFQLLVVTFGSLKALTLWGAITTGLPGIVVQLILLPCVVEGLRHQLGRRQSDALRSALNLIEEGRATCVVLRDNRIIKTEYAAGIGPMLELYDSGILKDAFVVDKIIGKAAAMVLVLGGARGCYGKVMSEAAIDYLQTRGVEADWQAKALTIIDRAGTGICPMEQTVSPLDDPEEGLLALREKLQQLRKANA